MAMSDVHDSIESYLKQQCLDPSGLYNWDRKYYRLSIEAGILEIIDSSNPQSPNTSSAPANNGKVCVRGAKYAKEWSILTPALGSFGFDIVWTSGRIWSFLADDEFMCRKWVQHVNVAIAIVNEGKQWVPDKLQPDSYVAPTKGSNALTADLSYASRKSLNETSLEAQSPMAAHPTTAPQTLPRYTEPSESSHKIIMSPARAAAGTSLQAAGSRASYFDASLEDISRIPNAAGSSDGSSGPNSSPESQFSDPAMESRRSNSHQTISLNQSQSKEGASVQPANLRSEFSSDRREASPERWQRPVSTERKKFPNRKTVEVLEIEVQELTSSLESIEADMKERVSALTAKYNEMRDKDRKIIADLRIQLEDAVMHVESEGHDVHAAQLRAMRETHRREIACLTDDSISERKKYEAGLSHEKAQTRAAEQREADTRRELINITTKCHALESELLRSKDAAVLEGKSLAAENERLRREVSINMEKLHEIRLESDVKARDTVAATVEKMNSKLSNTVEAIERAAYESAKKKFDVQKLQELASMQVECNRQIEGIRAQNKMTNASEIEALKRNFEAREEQTIMDLRQLESLHTRRVGELEASLIAWRTRAENAEEKAATALMSAARGSEATRAAAEDTMRQLESHADSVEVLQAALQKRHDELMESRSREASYREHLNRAIEECRVQRAQNLESLRQSSCDGAQAVHWKRVAQEVELNLTASNTSLQIARDEASMLENEVQRLSSQITTLQEALDRADKIVYGNAAAAVVKSKEMAGLVPSKSANRLPTAVKGVSLQDTRMSKRKVTSTLYSPVNDENRKNSFSPDNSGRPFPYKRITMYA